MTNYLIPAECHSDDQKVQISFDAISWFLQATEKQIQDLVDCEFGLDYPADAVAMFFDKTTTEKLFMYLDIIQDQGFECTVDREKASKWIKENRPTIAIDMDKYMTWKRI